MYFIWCAINTKQTIFIDLQATWQLLSVYILRWTVCHWHDFFPQIVTFTSVSTSLWEAAHQAWIHSQPECESRVYKTLAGGVGHSGCFVFRCTERTCACVLFDFKHSQFQSVRIRRSIRHCINSFKLRAKDIVLTIRVRNWRLPFDTSSLIADVFLLLAQARFFSSDGLSSANGLMGECESDYIESSVDEASE